MEMQTPATSADTAPDPADIAIAQAEARQRHRRCWLVIVGVVSLLVGYPLSIGPLVSLQERGHIPQVLIPVVTLYEAPLFWAYHGSGSKWVQSFYDWYFPFFRVKQ